MGLTKLLILCFFFVHIEAFQSFRRFGQKEEKRLSDINKPFYEKHTTELKYKILHGKSFDKDSALPPYLKKRNRRFKSIYESMHDYHNFEKKSKPSYFGHLEYQQLIHNEIPDTNLLTQLMLQNSRKSAEGDHKHNKKHHHSRSHQKIKKLRSKPEAGIMQKKLKI